MENETRAQSVREKLAKLVTSVSKAFIQIGNLLLEARDGEYHKVYGFNKFEDFVQADLGGVVGDRQAFYLVKVAENLKKHGISEKSAIAAGVSKLKLIFSKGVPKDMVQELVADAATMTWTEFQAKVEAVKNPAKAETTAEKSEEKGEKDEKDEKDGVVRLKFRLTAEQAAVVNAALAACEGANPSEKLVALARKATTMTAS